MVEDCRSPFRKEECPVPVGQRGLQIDSFRDSDGTLSLSHVASTTTRALYLQDM